jgi:putative transposase
LSRKQRQTMIEPHSKKISVRRQCELLGVTRSNLYYKKAPISQENADLMRKIDVQFNKTPFFGSRKYSVLFKSNGQRANRKRIQRLMRVMGIQAIYRKPFTSKTDKQNKIYPYLLRNLEIDRADQVWTSDITYIPMRRGFLYLVAVMDWHSRYVLSWRLSNSMDTSFCCEALDEALAEKKPQIFNTDQGSQFTSTDFTDRLKKGDVKISMDGKGSYLDNIFVERLWRSLKYEEVYLHAYESPREAKAKIAAWIYFYNFERPHQSLNYRTPWEVYQESNEEQNQNTDPALDSVVPYVVSLNEVDNPCKESLTF